MRSSATLGFPVMLWQPGRTSRTNDKAAKLKARLLSPIFLGDFFPNLLVVICLPAHLGLRRLPLVNTLTD